MSKLKVSVLIAVLMLTQILIFGQNKTAGKLTTKEIDKQISICIKEPCSEIVNKLYLINDCYLLWIREGDCSDNHYAYKLLGKGLKEICYSIETIAGNRTKYAAGMEDFFIKLMYGRNKENLGLDSSNTVKLIYSRK